MEHLIYMWYNKNSMQKRRFCNGKTKFMEKV